MNWLLLIVFLAGLHIVVTWMVAVWRAAAAASIAPPPQFRKHSPSVSVLIPAWNEHGILERCISTLHAVNYTNWEVIIVAGGEDGTYQAAIEACKNQSHFRVLKQTPHGKNAALNQAFQQSQGEIIVILDADSQVSVGWLDALVSPFDGVTLSATGRAIPLRTTRITQFEQMEQIAAYQIRGSTTLQGSGSIAVHRSLIEQMSGFPENVLVGVDWDLNARLAAQNVKRVFCPKATVKTERPATLSEYWRNEVRWRRAHISSLFRLSDHFLHSPARIAANLYIYALAWFSALFTVTAGIIMLAHGSDRSIMVVEAWLVFLSWLLLRRIAIAIEVAVFLRDLSWLKMAWVPPILLCVTLAAILPATLTVKQMNPHFKGPRVHHHDQQAS